MDKTTALKILTMRAHDYSWPEIQQRFSQSYSSGKSIREAMRWTGRANNWDIDWAFPQRTGGGAVSAPSDWKERIT